MESSAASELSTLQRGLITLARRHRADFYSHLACMLPTVTGDTDYLHLFTNHCGHWRRHLEQFHLLGDALPLVQHATERRPPVIWSATQPMLTLSPYRDEMQDEARRAAAHGIRSGLVCPLPAADLAWGWIALSWRAEIDAIALGEAARAVGHFAANYDATHARLVRGLH